MKKITTAIIPVAGLGTRLLPLTKSVPKELLPIYNKPVIQYIVDEAVQAGITKIIFVISHEKLAIKNYFEPSDSLQSLLTERKKTVELQMLSDLESAAEFEFAYQDIPHGDGHAIQQALPFLTANEDVVVLFGDDLVDNPGGQNAVEQLLEKYYAVQAPVLLLQEVPKSETFRYGIVDLVNKESFQVKKLVEKPTPEKAPSNLAIVGKYILTASVLKKLNQASVGDGELRLADVLSDMLVEKEPLFAVSVRGTRFDTGQIRGLMEASHHFFVQGSLN